MSIEGTSQGESVLGNLSSGVRDVAGLILKGTVRMTLVTAEKVTGVGVDAEKLVAEQPKYDVEIGLQTIADGVEREDAELIDIGQQYIDRARQQL